MAILYCIIVRLFYKLMMLKDFTQEITQIRYPFEEYGKYPNDDRILFERVHNFLSYKVRRNILIKVIPGNIYFTMQPHLQGLHQHRTLQAARCL
jgi:hypothetical protein